MISLMILLIAATAYINVSGSRKSEPTKKERDIQISKKQYVCSMHPQVIQDSPGDCPICGMLLIEKIAEDDTPADSSLKNVTGNVNRTILGKVATVSPVKSALPVIVTATGVITCDPRQIRTVSANYKGVIEKSFIKYQFQPVKKGQKMYQVYCPDIYVDKWNYVLLIQAYHDQDNLTTEATEWFRLLGLTEGQIDSLKHAVTPDYHLNVYCDADGYAVGPDFNADTYFISAENGLAQDEADKKRIELNEGLAIGRGDALFKIIDPVYLRVDLKVATEDVGLLKTGQQVFIQDGEINGHTFSGSISQIEPLNGGYFQLLKVYIKDNEKILKPGRQIKGWIKAEDRDALWIPQTAVVDMGLSRSVFVLKEGRFISRNVETGLQLNKMIEITKGLDINSELALNGLLLVDSDGLIDAN